jgi:hypothetical protein
MLINTGNGQSFDTETDLTAPERHILQKLFLWESMASSLGQFKEKKDQALNAGWNNSGPVSESTNLKLIIQTLEKKIKDRLQKAEQ